MSTPNYSQIKLVSEGGVLSRLRNIIDLALSNFEKLDYKVNKAVDDALVESLKVINELNQGNLQQFRNVAKQDDKKSSLQHEAFFPYVEATAKAITEFIDSAQEKTREVRDAYREKGNFRKKDIYTSPGQAKAAIQVLTSFNEKLRRNYKSFKDDDVPEELTKEFGKLVRDSHIETAEGLINFFKRHPEADKVHDKVFRLLNEAWLRHFTGPYARNTDDLTNTLEKLLRWAKSASMSTANSQIVLFRGAAGTAPGVTPSKVDLDKKVQERGNPIFTKMHQSTTIETQNFNESNDEFAAAKDEFKARAQTGEPKDKEFLELKEKYFHALTKNVKAKRDLSAKYIEIINEQIKSLSQNIQENKSNIETLTQGNKSGSLSDEQKKKNVELINKLNVENLVVQGVIKVLQQGLKHHTSILKKQEQLVSALPGLEGKHSEELSSELAKSPEDFTLGSDAELTPESLKASKKIADGLTKIIEVLGQLPKRLDGLDKALSRIDEKYVKPILDYMSQSRLRKYINMPSLTRKDRMEELGWKEEDLSRFAMKPEDLKKIVENRQNAFKSLSRESKELQGRLAKFIPLFEEGRFKQDKIESNPLQNYA